MKTNKGAGLDFAITAEALQGGGDLMIDAIHTFYSEVYTNMSPPKQWVSNFIIPLPKKGDLSLMTNYRGITLMSIAAKVYNKILLNRIRPHLDPLLRKNQAGFCPGRSCTQQIHILRRIMEGFRENQLPLIVTFVDFKKAFDSINRSVVFSVLRHYGIPETLVNAIQVLYTNSSSSVMVDEVSPNHFVFPQECFRVMYWHHFFLLSWWITCCWGLQMVILEFWRVHVNQEGTQQKS